MIDPFVVSFDADLRVAAILGILTLIFLFHYSAITALHRGKLYFWLGCSAVIIGAVTTTGFHVTKIPRGVLGTYYGTPDLSGKPVDSLRYFERPGQRIDRFIDFDPNDFNDRYPFSGSSFSVEWEGYIYLPTAMSGIELESNCATELTLDGRLIQSPPLEIDAGRPEAGAFLGDWSYNESRQDGDKLQTFVWSSGAESDVYLGIPEPDDYRLSFRALSFQYPGSPEQHVTVAANGIVLETVPFPASWDWKTYTVSVPRSVFRQAGPSVLWIRFSYSNPVRPSEVIDSSSDRRNISIALDTLSVKRISGEVRSPAFPARQQQFSSGIHRIRVKAYSDGHNPFIRLVWKTHKRSQWRRIPADYLFPSASRTAQCEKTFSRERAALSLSIIYKWGLVLLLLGLLVRAHYPQLKALRGKTFLNRHTLLLASIVVFAFLVRLLFLFEMRSLDSSFYVLPDTTDHLSYWFFARGFFRGYWPSLTHEAFFQAPLISYYLILCSILFGESMLMTRIATAFLSACSLMFVFGIARRAFNNPVAYTAAALCACNGVLIFYDTSLLLGPLIVFLNLATLCLMYILRERLSWRTTILLGLVIGLTGLARANIVLLMPFFFLWMLFGFPGSLWRKCLHYGCIGIVAILTILPVSIRNYYAGVHHSWVWTNSNGGITFWIGNNPSSNGKFSYSGTVLKESRERMRKEGTSYGDEVFRYVKERTKEYVKLEYTKFKLFWRGYEIGNNIPYYVFRGISRILRLPWVNFVLLGPLAICGMVLACRRWKEAFILYGFAGVQLATTLIFFALARYRLPVVPVFSIFAAYATWRTVHYARQRKWLFCLLIFAGVSLSYVLMNYPYASSCYQDHYGERMPVVRMLRYWDVFHLQRL
ncbi:hypothetical protein CSB45_00260 [candidate division KSB3 bacterium]|uniref:Glycosyltransferase RgtA/B/C/D-like domain-containing protein n=1 Tax=candidate division KSB3 bacterium TaxID=2044937 RepID=A0A2G6EE68_9BACT|nr:MAG: hypothetical protein CSB45_00260 [candidate division KSB3 bacterium]PIE28377.1 MAG: hypothetical protein CSA57_14110 [candidate division KSB3 bacterium]